LADEKLLSGLVEGTKGIHNPSSAQLAAWRRLQRGSKPSETLVIISDRLSEYGNKCDSLIKVPLIMKVISGDVENSSEAVEAAVAGTMKAKTFDYDSLERFCHLFEFLGDADEGLNDVCRKMGRVLGLLKRRLQGKLPTADMKAKFSVNMGVPARLTFEHIFREQRTANGYQGGLPQPAIDHIEKVALPGAELAKLGLHMGSDTNSELAALKAQVAMLSNQLSPAKGRGQNGGKKSGGGPLCHKWDGKHCPFGTQCRFTHTPGVDTRKGGNKRAREAGEEESVAKNGATEACRDFAAGKCT
jgi:hypothetical protein